MGEIICHTSLSIPPTPAMTMRDAPTGVLTLDQHTLHGSAVHEAKETDSVGLGADGPPIRPCRRLVGGAQRGYAPPVPRSTVGSTARASAS